MDYSELVNAVQQGDEQTTNKLCAEATVLIKKYLVSKVDASEADAADAVQRMFEYVIPKIKNDEIEKPTGLLSYMLTCARHKYLKIVDTNPLDDYEEYSHKFVAPAQQAWKLIQNENRSIVKHCLAKLKDSYRRMAEFLFRFPGADGEELGEEFNITPSNAWARKHRALKKLADCVRSIS